VAAGGGLKGWGFEVCHAEKDAGGGQPRTIAFRNVGAGPYALRKAIHAWTPIPGRSPLRRADTGVYPGVSVKTG
jgi:hypothetical protein